MQPCLFVGDLHGRVEVIEALKKQFPGWHYVFVGDYVDSFNRPPRQQFSVLNSVLELCEADRATGLKGNHEDSYWENKRCSGWNWGNDAAMSNFRKRAYKVLQDYIWDEDDRILVTHAGVCYPWWEQHGLTRDEPLCKQLFRLRHADPEAWYQIGFSRGGSELVGGPQWCDWTMEFEPVPGINQVFGHSATFSKPKHCVEKKNGKLRYTTTTDSVNWNVDCLAERTRGLVSLLAWDDNGFQLKVLDVTVKDNGYRGNY